MVFPFIRVMSTARVVLLLVLFCTSIWSAVEVIKQEEGLSAVTARKPVREVNKLGVGFYLLGPDGPYGGWINYYATSRFGIEVGGTYLSTSWQDLVNAKSTIGFHIGVKLYFSGDNPEKKWSGYIGAFYHEWLYLRNGSFSSAVFPDIYFPLGIEYLGYSGITLAAEIAFDPVYAAFLLPWGGIKFGWHF